MTISSAISQYGNNAAVQTSLADSNSKKALLYSAESGDTATSAVLGALYSEQSSEQTMLGSIGGSFLGNNLDISA